MSRTSLIDAAKQIDISRFIKKEDFSLSVKSKKLDELYERYRTALENGNVIAIARARRNLIGYKCRLGSGNIS